MASFFSRTCDKNDGVEVIKDIESENLNVTLLVAVCRRVCYTVLGSGNPDMAGKGVMISYYFQVILAFLFGPLLPLFIRIAKKKSCQPILRRIPVLEKLLLSVVQTSLFYSSSLYIAAVVRYYQTPSISEFIILGPLLNLQLTTVTYLLCGLALEWRLKDFTIPLEWLLCSFAVALSEGLASIALRLRFQPVPEKERPYYHSLAVACDKQVNVTRTAYYFTKDYRAGRSIEESVFLICLPAAWLIMFLIPQNWKRLPEPVIRRVHWKECKLVLSGVLVGFLSYTLAFSIRSLLYFRHEAQHISQKDFQDTSWGYGQTTAVLIWAPFSYEAIKETFKHERMLRAVHVQQPAIELQESNTTSQSRRPSAENLSTADIQIHQQRRESSDSGNRLMQHDADHDGEEDDIVSGISRRDTEARIEGRGAGGQGSTERAATWQYDHLQDPPDGHRLRRRLT
ncbi:hypothetical protein BKA65DRAFT_513218 [Rhexocercosporidium sp. MPI-PUGE-AT-0058]|nr:hypothetical protein BKA65DRAFT_513218 [Rhexocercosporidium sp. MPI-PUGE-AT-0058]